MPICAVASCTSVFRKGSSPSFFSFPSEPAIRDRWATLCKRADKFNLNTSRICSEHFKTEDYDSSYLLQRKLCPDSVALARLKKEAVPSLKLPAALNTDVNIKRKFGQGIGKQKKKLRCGARIKVIELNDQPLLATTTENDQETSKGSGPKAVEEEAPQEAGSAPDDPAERRRRSQQLRRERHERKERKELVEQLLAQHDQRQLEAAAAISATPATPAKTGAKVRCKVFNSGHDARKKGGASEVEVEILPDSPAAAEDAAGDSPPPPAADGVRYSGPGADAADPRPLAKHPSLMVERTKEILRLKLKVRKLETKCLRVLGVAGALSSDTPDTGGGDEGLEPPGEREGQAENPERPQVDPSPATGEMPLVVLRDDKLPGILTQLRQTRQSYGLRTLTPADLREAQEINHQLKVQMLGLQASVLRWVIKNKRMRDARLRRAREYAEKNQRTVRAVRLRELLRIESAVKAIFSEAQVRAMIRQQADDSIPPSRRKGATQWGDEDLRQVLELRAISSDRVVEHVRDKMKIPLPSMRTTKKRCHKSPELNEVYREIMQKSEDSQKRCAMCERQVTTIDEVIEAAPYELPDDSATYGRQFVQHVPSPPPPRSPEQPAAQSRPRKRRRAPAAAPVRTRKKVRTQAAASDDWAETDSDSELSDPGLWDRLGSGALAAVPGQPSGRLDDHLRRHPPDPYGGVRKAWR